MAGNMGLLGLVPEQVRSLRTLLCKTGAVMRRHRLISKNKMEISPNLRGLGELVEYVQKYSVLPYFKIHKVSQFYMTVLTPRDRLFKAVFFVTGIMYGKTTKNGKSKFTSSK